MANGEHGPLGQLAVQLAEEEAKQGAELAVTQHLTSEEQLVLGWHLRNKTVPPKTAQLVSQSVLLAVGVDGKTILVQQNAITK